jgi:hypothetical protein
MPDPPSNQQSAASHPDRPPRQTRAPQQKKKQRPRKLYGQRYVLVEQRRIFDELSQDVSSLDQKLQSLLGSASLIISLAGVVQITQLLRSGGWVFGILMLVALVLYVSMVGVILYGLRATTIGYSHYIEPVDERWLSLRRRYFNKSEQLVLEQAIRDYLAVIKENETLIKRKMSNLEWAIRLFALIMIIIAISLFQGALV